MIKQDRYDKKNGLVSKSYKLHKSVVADFKEACDFVGISQGRKIEEMMIDFIMEVDGKD